MCRLLKTFVLFNRKQQRELLLFEYFPLRKANCNSKVAQLFIFLIWSISWFFHSVYNINLFFFVCWCLLLRSPFIVTNRLLFSVKVCNFSYFLALHFSSRLYHITASINAELLSLLVIQMHNFQFYGCLIQKLQNLNKSIAHDKRFIFLAFLRRYSYGLGSIYFYNLFFLNSLLIRHHCWGRSGLSWLVMYFFCREALKTIHLRSSIMVQSKFQPICSYVKCHMRPVVFHRSQNLDEFCKNNRSLVFIKNLKFTPNL